MPRIPDHKDHAVTVDIIQIVVARNLSLASIA
jgi:hypothetical protein